MRNRGDGTSDRSSQGGSPGATRPGKHVAAPPVESEIRDDDWAGLDISGQTHERVAFIGIDLIDVVNTGGSFTECTFRDCRLNASTHTAAAFVNCTFVGCAFFDATFTDCKLVGTSFDRCTFGLFKIVGGDWSFVALAGADLRRTSITGTRMREADLTGARLQESTLHHVDLAGAWLHGVDLTGADLRGSDVSSVDPVATSMRGAIIDVEQATVLAEAFGLSVRDDVPRP